MPIIQQKLIIPNERIINKIFIIRGKKVMIDRDLAELYEVETKVLNQAVKRNIRRFPDDFMFKLTLEETKSLRSQFVTSKTGRGGRRYLPYAFTEHGVAMLSSVLNSERAIQINILIIKNFIKLRKLLSTHKKLQQKIEQIERKYDKKSAIIFETIKKLMAEEESPKTPIGFKLS